MIAHPGLLTTEAEIKQLAERLRAKDVIAFDTEFIRETTFFPTVEIIQVATDEESWLIDAQAFLGRSGAKRGASVPVPLEKSQLKPLLDVFADPKILKIVHAAQGDQECLYTSFGMVASPSLDTAVAASLCGLGDGIGLSNLLKSVLNVAIKKGHARTNWSVRPLPEQLIEYAHVDVEHLVELGRKMLGRLDKLGRRDWALESSAQWENKALYEIDPEGLAQKVAKSGRIDKAGYAALIELVRWREARVRQLNVPRRWVADDNVLLDLSHVRPKDMEHLGAFRGLNKGELRNSGEAILAALKRAADGKLPDVPRGPRTEIPSAGESQVMDLLKCYVGILSERHQIASRHLVGPGQWLPLIRSEAKNPEDYVKAEALSPAACRLIGAEVFAFLTGKRALAVEGARVKVADIG